MVKKACEWASVLIFVSVQALPMTLLAAQASEASTSSTSSLVAEVSQRIETDRLEVRVYQGKQLVQLARFMELFVVTPLGGRGQTMESLVGRSVAIVPSEKRRDRWEIYQDVWAGTGKELTLADNVFRVKQVFASSRRRPVEIKLDGQVIQLKSGDALLVL